MVAPCVQRTSLASISRPGIESACARGDRSRLRFSWYAFVFWASFSTLIIPRQTAVARSRRAPLKAKSDVVFGAWWDWNVSKSRCWRPSAKYAPVTREVAPCPARSFSIRTLPFLEPKPPATQSSSASRPTCARCEAKCHVSRARFWSDTYSTLAACPTKISETAFE